MLLEDIRSTFLVQPELARDSRYFDAVVAELHETIDFLRHELEKEDAITPARVGVTLLPYQVDELVSLRRDQSSAAVLASIEEVHVCEVFEVATTASRPQTTAYSWRITIEPTQATVFTNKPWLLRVVSNFVSNAIAHSRGDHIELSAEELADRLVLHIRDNGRGMLSDQVNRLFQDKYKADEAAVTTGTLKGGRGIKTAMLLIDAMHGKLDCTSTKGGTHWRVRLPRTPPSPLRLPPILRENQAWLNGILHDIRTPMNNLSARRSVGPKDSVLRAAAARLPNLVNELAALIQADMNLTNVATAESFSLGDQMNAAALASIPLRDHRQTKVQVQPCHLSVHAPVVWLFRILVDLLRYLADSSEQIELSAGYDAATGTVVIDMQSFSDGPQRGVLDVDGACLTARTLIRAMAGSLEVQRIARGLVHRIRLRLHVVNVPAVASYTPRENLLEGKTVFILDDNYDLAVDLAVRFQDVGAQAMVFTDELEMLTMAQQMEPPPDLYLLDFMLDNSFAFNSVRVCSRKPEKPHVVVITSHPTHPELQKLVPAVPVLTKQLSDLHFRALVALLRDEIKDLQAFATRVVPTGPSARPDEAMS